MANKKTETSNISNEEIMTMMNEFKSLIAQLNDLKAENEKLKEEKEEMKSSIGGLEDRWIKIVNLKDNPVGFATAIKLGNRTINLGSLYSTASLRYNEFEELAGMYEDYFKNGWIAVSAKDRDVAELRDLPVFSKPEISLKELDNFYKKTKNEIIASWDGYSERTKNMVIQRFMRGYFEDDEKYKDEKIINTLNTLSDNKMSVVLEDIKFKEKTTK